MSVWAAMAAVVAVATLTYGMRAVVIVAVANRRIPRPIERALQYVGPAVLAALAVNLAAGGEGGPNLEVAEVCALLVAGGVAWWRRNVMWTLIAGMTTLLLLSEVL